jgi:hypothetical protein
MVLTGSFGEYDALWPRFISTPAPRSLPVKPHLKIHSDEPENIPTTLRFSSASDTRSEAQRSEDRRDIALSVEHAIEDAQRKLDDLRRLIFPDDDGTTPPRAA